MTGSALLAFAVQSASAQIVLDMPAPPPAETVKPNTESAPDAPSADHPAERDEAAAEFSLGDLALGRYARARTTPRPHLRPTAAPASVWSGHGWTARSWTGHPLGWPAGYWTGGSWFGYSTLGGPQSWTFTTTICPKSVKSKSSGTSSGH
ncbi:MAG: hypothetical protein EA377_13565 [Phycisphaerales bacterium]|nr:MAG: hypothetical protein EA377_13565 [Phycisphaerales bacterium]